MYSKDKIRLILSFFCVAPIIILIRILSPIYRINLVEIRSDRIGHFIPDSIEYIFLGPQRRAKNIYFYSSIICNNYWAKKVKKELFVVNSFFNVLTFWNRKFPGNSLNTYIPRNPKIDISDWYSRSETIFQFTEVENNIGYDFLSKFGWTKGQPFICLLVRDNEYLRNIQPEINWAYHDYRNSSIENYTKAVDYITKQDIWIIRMGRIVSKPLNFSHKNFIEYAFSDKRSDFLDIWLFANANGCITTGSGPDWVSVIYEVPILYINYLPLAHLTTRSNCIFFPKHLSWVVNGASLTLVEILANNFFVASEYKERGIKITDLSPDEILLAVKEFLDLLYDSNFASQPSNLEPLIRRFFGEMARWTGFTKLPNFLTPKGLPSKTWLAGQGSNFFD